VDKLVASAAEAVGDVPSGASQAVAGSGVEPAAAASVIEDLADRRPLVSAAVIPADLTASRGIELNRFNSLRRSVPWA
jgi:hypothetical protein